MDADGKHDEEGQVEASEDVEVDGEAAAEIPLVDAHRVNAWSIDDD